MCNLLRALAVFGLLSACATTEVSRSVPDIQTVKSFSELEADLQNLRPGRSLAVFDLDNTLLTMKGDLGSVAWYDWQDELDNDQVIDPGEIPSKLLAQGILYATRDMQPTEPSIRTLTDELQARGVDVLVLTARGPEFRSATLTQLKRASLKFDRVGDCGPPLCEKRGIVSPEHVERLARERFGDAFDTQGFKRGRSLSASDGVVMLAGQNKGVALTLLLDSLPTQYDQLMFVDDSANNVQHVADAAPFIDAGLRVFHYVRFRSDDEAFLNSAERQKDVGMSWNKIREAFCEELDAPEWCEKTQRPDSLDGY